MPATLELGGKNPMYVAEDVDVEVAAEGAVRACFVGTGQVCVSIERIYVHEDVADAFTAAFVRRTRELRLGSGLDYRSDVGSLTSAAQLATVVEHVEDAVGHGATVLAGGVHRTDLGPWFYEPTILTDVPNEARLAREETFGPVVSIYRVASDDEAIAAMNDSEFGLNASIWTADTAPRRGARRRASAQGRSTSTRATSPRGGPSVRRRAGLARRASAAGTVARGCGRPPGRRRSRCSTGCTACSVAPGSGCTGSSTWARRRGHGSTPGRSA